jgi:hypothetical protein
MASILSADVKDETALQGDLTQMTVLLDKLVHTPTRIIAGNTKLHFLMGRSSANQEIPRILRNPNYHDIHKRPPPDRILSQINPLNISPSPFLKIHFNTVLLLHLGLPCGPFPSGLPAKTLYAPFCFPCVLHAPSISFFLI